MRLVGEIIKNIYKFNLNVMTKVHKNTKVLRSIYNFIKILKDEGLSVKATAKEVEKEFDLVLSESTIRHVRSSKNYKQYRMGWKKTTTSQTRPFGVNRITYSGELPVPLITYEYKGEAGSLYKVACSESQKHWYSNIFNWFRWLGGNK